MALVTEENRRWWTLGAVTFSLFLTYLDTTVVNVALPAMRDEFGVNINQLAWVINGYLITYAVFLLLGGKLADYFGRRRIFQLGLVIFTVTSIFCGAASSHEMLTIARTMQGIGSAMMLPGSQSIIAATFPREQRGLAFGIWTGVAGVGLAIGPLVGGLITQGFDWRWIFYINIPLGLAGLVAAQIFVRESKDESADQRFDIAGLLAAATFLFLLTFGLLQANDRGWTSTAILVIFAGAALALAAFIVLELRQRAPAVDLRLFRVPQFTGAIYSAAIVLFAMFGVLFFMSLYLQTVLRYSPTEAGAIFLPMTVVFLVTAPIAGKLTDRVGVRVPIAGGMALLGLALLYLSRLDGGSGFWEMVPGLIVGGIGMGMAVAPTTMTVVSSVPLDKAGVAAGLLNSHRQMGGNLGVAIMGAVVAAHIGALEATDAAFRSAFVGGIQDAFLIGGFVALGGAVMAAATISGRERAETPGLAEMNP